MDLTRHASVEVAWRRLVVAGWVFAGGSALHLFDHLRRGQGSVTEELYWLGNIALIVQVTVVAFVLTRQRIAPLLATVFGPALAVGFFAAHWLPQWSAMSDPVWDITSWTWLSVFASSAEILGALAVTVTGIGVIRSVGLAHVLHASPDTDSPVAASPD